MDQVHGVAVHKLPGLNGGELSPVLGLLCLDQLVPLQDCCCLHSPTICCGLLCTIKYKKSVTNPPAIAMFTLNGLLSSNVTLVDLNVEEVSIVI